MSAPVYRGRHASSTGWLPAPLEGEEQKWLFQWIDTQRVSHPELRWVFAVPNGGKRPKGEAGKMKAQGARRGYPDIGLDLPMAKEIGPGIYHGLRIELKRRGTGTPSQDQKDWEAQLVSVGYCHRYAWGWEQARDQLLAYIAGAEPPIGTKR
jgi:hypothetical protein